jgi:hypothetical protein
MTAEALRLSSPAWRQARLPGLLVGAIIVAAGVAATVRLPAGEPVSAAAVAGIGGVAIWMFATARYERSLAVVMLYIGLADGYLKLRTGSDLATLGRDILLYAIVAGALVRWSIRGERVEFPPLSVWVVAWIVVVLVQVLNPANGTLGHSLAAVRPHLEWVPLFFIGYVAMRSTRRLRGFLILLLVVGAVNGVVGLIQFNMTPEQLASWGPGYERRITGEGDVAARGFADEDGVARTRPFALGSDMGFGGGVGVLAVPAALALLAAGSLRWRLLTLLLSSGVILGIVTSQARVAVVGGVVAALAFAALSVTSRVAFRTVLALTLATIVTYASVSILTSNSDSGAFDRYSSIAPGKAAATTYDYRRDTLKEVPEYMVDFPLGAGIGSKGPGASTEGRGTAGTGLNGESQVNFLLIELGIPGLLVMLGLNMKLIGLSMRRVRKFVDPHVRLYLAAVAAPVVALFATWVVGVSTATTPGAPYLWFAAGTLAYWLVARPADTRPAAGPTAPRPAFAPRTSLPAGYAPSTSPPAAPAARPAWQVAVPHPAAAPRPLPARRRSRRERLVSALRAGRRRIGRALRGRIG